jgi:hypothetical protein
MAIETMSAPRARALVPRSLAGPKTSVAALMPAKATSAARSTPQWPDGSVADTGLFPT